MTVIAAGDFSVSPSAGLIVWTAMIGALVVAAVVTASKGRWGWLVVGLLSGGALWLATAFLSATPHSLWARTFYGAEKMRRVRSRFDARPGT